VGWHPEAAVVSSQAGQAGPEPVESYVVVWENAAGEQYGNQVYASDRDQAIWRLALLMLVSNPHDIKFVSCEKEYL
jgi:hypothetical protein